MRPSLFARHQSLREHPACVAAAGTWERWRQLLPELEPFQDLDALITAWGSVRSYGCYLAVAALANQGSARGAADEDAALAVIAVLHVDIDIIASQLARICEPDEVLEAVWEAICRSKPTLGCRAAYFLLHRAMEKLVLRSERYAPEWPHPRVVELEAHGAASGKTLRGSDGPVDEVDELTDLLMWATATGVVPESEALLLKQLVLLERQHRGMEEAMRHAGAIHGVGLRTVRRRRSSAVERLRHAVPEYLAAVS